MPPFSRFRPAKPKPAPSSPWDAFPQPAPQLSDAEIAAQRDGSLANLARRRDSPTAPYAPGTGVVPSASLLDRWNAEEPTAGREPLTAAEREERGL